MPKNFCLAVALKLGYVVPVSIADIRKLPLREKLQILEAIWEDFGAQVERMEISPTERELLH